MQKKWIVAIIRGVFICTFWMTRQQIGLIIWWLGMFLFGTYLFEEATGHLVTRNFKNILRTATNSLLKSIGTGIFVTSVLQSSSVVSLLVLSFVSAGIIDLSSGVGVILGTNIGTPLLDIILGNLWLKFSFSSIALPMIWVASLCFLILSKNNKLKYICKIFIGLGLIFLGLGYMKESMAVLSGSVNFAQYANLSIFVYFALWLLITMAMQSSTATIVLVLTAANSRIIDYRMGLPLIMGAFLWTTITAVLWSMGPNAVKKQVAFSHVLFNLFSAIIGMSLLPLLVIRLKMWFTDVVLGLSVFAIWFKIGGVLLMSPFVSQFVRLLQYLFPERPTLLGLAVEKVDPDVPEAALVAMKKDCVKLLKKTFQYIMHLWDVDEQRLLQEESHELFSVLSKEKVVDGWLLEQEYLTIKSIEENLIAFGAQVKRYSNKLSDVQQISRFYQIISAAVSAAKYMKDVAHNIDTLQDHGQGWLFEQYRRYRIMVVTLYKDISKVIDGEYSHEIVREMVGLVHEIKNSDQDFLESLTKELSREKIDKLDLSGVLHVNRYVYLSSLSIVGAVKDLLLTDEERRIFDQLQ